MRYLGIPLRAKDRILGVLNVLGTATGAHRERARDLALIGSIGDQIGVALDNAQLLLGREERLSQLTNLNDLLRALAAILDVESLHEAIYLGCSRLFDTNTFYIALNDPATGVLIARRWYAAGVRLVEREGAAARPRPLAAGGGGGAPDPHRRLLGRVPPARGAGVAALRQRRALLARRAADDRRQAPGGARPRQPSQLLYGGGCDAVERHRQRLRGRDRECARLRG